LEDLVTPAAAFWSDKRVLITGHTGFKGVWLSLWLRSLGAEVHGLALPAAEGNALPVAVDLAALVDNCYGDIRDLGVVSRRVEQTRPQIILHLAAQSLVRASYQNPVATYATNVMGTVHVLAAAREAPSVRCVVVVTSDKCYENREWVWGYREDDPLGGHDPYSSSKACAELATAAWRRSFADGVAPQLGIASARAGNVIGGGDWAEDRLVPDCMRALFAGKPIGIRNPRATRPWQHVLEPLCGYLLLAERLWEDPQSYGQAWNFGPTDEDIRPVDWIASHIARAWGGDARWEAVGSGDRHEATSLKVDASKARTCLGWRQRLRLETALDWTVEWYKATRGGARAVDLIDGQIDRFTAMAAH